MSHQFEYQELLYEFNKLKEYCNSLENENILLKEKNSKVDFESEVWGEKIQDLFDKFSFGLAQHIIVYDSEANAINYKLLNVNTAYELHTGLKKEFVRKKLATDVYQTNEPPYFDIFYDTVKNKQINKFSVYFEPLNRFFDVSVIPYGENGFFTEFRDISEIIKSHNELLESEQKFRILFELASVGVAQIDTKTGRFIKINKKYSDIIGYSNDEITGLNFQIISFPNDLENDLQFMDKLIKGEIDEFSMEKRLIRKDGSVIWVFLSVSPMWKFGNEPNYHIAVITDITHKKKIEKSLQESEEKFRLISENTSDGILKVGVANTIEYLSPSYLKIMGYSNDEILNLDQNSIYSAIHPEDRDALFEKIFKAIEERKPDLFYEYRCLHRNENYIWREDHATFIYDNSGNYQGAYIVCRDVSERKIANEEIIKLKLAVEYSPNTIIITNNKGKVEYANNKTFELTAYTQEEVLGKDPSIFKSGNTQREVYRDLWKTIKSGNVWRGELQNKKKNGELYWEKISISPLINKKGKITHFIAIKEDVTERKLAEEHIKKIYDELKVSNDIIEKSLFEKNLLVDELSESESKLKETIALKDKFFAIIAHDLRGPFSGFLGLTDLMSKEADDLSVKEIKTISTAINKSANSLYQLIDDLLVWSRTQTGAMPFFPESLELAEITQNALFSLKQTALNKSITFENHIPKGIILKGDRNMITTVFRNIISNAIKFSFNGGKIEIAVPKSELDLIQENNSLDFVTIQIKDYGKGITDVEFDKLFKIDQQLTTLGTNSEKGTGLGLILCKEFIEKHDGKIWAESSPSIGTIFNFTLPIDLNFR